MLNRWKWAKHLGQPCELLNLQTSSTLICKEAFATLLSFLTWSWSQFPFRCMCTTTKHSLILGPCWEVCNASSFPRRGFDVCPTKWTFFRDLCRWRVSNLTCFDSFHSFISVEVSLSYKLLTNSVILYTNRARTHDSPSQRAKTTWLRELHQCSYVTILGFIWQLLTFEENESFAGFIKYRNTTLLEPFENVVDF